MSSEFTSPNSDQLAKVQVILIDLSDKDGRHCLVQGCAVHVDGGSYRQHEASDLPVHSAVLQETLHGDWQCGRAVNEDDTVRVLHGLHSKDDQLELVKTKTVSSYLDDVASAMTRACSSPLM